MNDRQRFLATMHYQERDRCPICDFGFWNETIDEWKKQGLPDHVVWPRGGPGTVSTHDFFGMDTYTGGPGVGVGLMPGFESKVLEDRGDHEVVQQNDGVRVLRRKYMSSIPQHHGHLLTDRESWEKHYKPRLDPDTPQRYPDWEQARKVWGDDECPHPRVVGGGSLYGWLRNWMGMEAISYLVYDDPALFEEMVTTIADLIVETHRRAFEHGARFDACSMWEDMCFNTGPLLSPDKFKRYLAPHYRRITEQLRANGCDIVWVDCDGNIEHLVPIWLDAGVNCMFPVEVGVWQADVVAYRKQYGPDLLMMGGFDKHILAQTKADIEREVHRLTPLVEDGGFIPFCDHRVPPDVPLENYVYYLELARREWGCGINLRPMSPIPGITAGDG